MRNDNDYARYAQAIVKDYTDKSTPDLQTGVVKLADDLSLNPNETRRLVEKTNLAAHLALFDKTSQDNYVQFDVVDPDVVMGELFGRVTPAACVHEKTAAVLDVDYDDLLRDLNVDTTTKLAHIAAEPPELTPMEHHYVEKKAQIARSINARRLRNVRAELTTKLGQLEQDYEEKVAQIVQGTRSIYGHDVRDVVEAALNLHGERALPLVAKLASVARLDTAQEVDPDRFIHDEPWHRDIKVALEIYEECNVCADALTRLDGGI